MADLKTAEQLPEVAKEDPTYSAFLEHMRLMHTIVREMKEIPELPSEVPKDVHTMERVEFPEGGGILTYFGGNEYPYRGFPFHEFVDRIDLIKKITRAVLSGLYHSLQSQWKIKLLTLLPSIWLAKHVVRAGLYAFYRVVERFKIKPMLYCNGMRELHRAFSLEGANESYKTKEFRHQLRDMLCMTLEFDNAYRYRFQDVIVELDKAALQRNPTQELSRLLKILSSREIGQDVKDTWKLLTLGCSHYLRYDKELLTILTLAFLSLDIEKMRLTVEDKHYCIPRKDYLFGFSLEEKKQETKELCHLKTFSYGQATRPHSGR